MNNVLRFNVTQKTVKENYRKKEIVYTYDADTETWHWRFMKNLKVSGKSKTLPSAKRMAHKKVDTLDGDK